MDYQASSISSKELVSKRLKIALCSFLTLFILFEGSPLVRADDPAPNPLTQDITINAMVLQYPGVNPDTPPISPTGSPNTSSLDAVVFKGLAYPGSVISLLKNGIILAQIPANPDGTFDLRIRNLDAGIYSFGLRAEDSNGLTSKLLMFTLFVSSSVTLTVEGIFIPPTITTDKLEVKKGDQISFYGRSAPGAEVRLSIIDQFSSELLKKTQSDGNGAWIYTMNSQDLSFGDFTVKARQLTASDTSIYSDAVDFRVSNVSRTRPQISRLFGFRKRCDLNDDGRVNLLDFSIMAFWYKRLTFPPKVDLNSDRLVNLTDLSILAYCWTG